MIDQRETRLHGLLAEFNRAGALVDAARRAQSAGYRYYEAYSPFPVEGLAAAVGFNRTGLGWLVFAGGAIGAIGGFYLQYYASVISFPVNVGGRPLASWPAFGVVAFELCILAGALTCVLGMLGLNGLPRPNHPVFNVPAFELASRSHFFLLVESSDELFEPERTRQFLLECGADAVHDVEY